MMTTTEAGLMQQMGVWRHCRSKGLSDATLFQAELAERKRKAWTLWQRRAILDELTLIEIVEGPRAERWSSEREARERQLFEEFWAEYVIGIAEDQFACAQAAGN